VAAAVTVEIVEDHALIQPGDLLIREKLVDEEAEPGWTALPRGRYCWRIATAGDTRSPKPDVILRGTRDDGDDGAIPCPTESPQHDRDDPCPVCDPLQVWNGAWWDDDSP
jgi:hypothetical protein